MTDLHGEESLSAHTLALRKAVEYCEAISAIKHIHIDDKILREARQREAHQDEVRKQAKLLIDVIHAADLSCEEFRNRYHYENRPCLIRGMQNFFQRATEEWTTENGIRYDWFRQRLGETKVPVRQLPATEKCLDEQGRAQECKIIEMTYGEWLSNLDQPELYLKDWHLVSWLEQNDNDSTPLYQVPDIFQYDMLNNFMTRFTKGDYRFVYHGTIQSTTLPHSDVLNSFSWSYNVKGTKQWTFYKYGSSCDIVQRTGECMFVPATWEHKVVNLEETLSINHNWITTANVDLTWKCIYAELKEVDAELKKWGIADLGAHESMLRGCVGLDVSTFYLMCIARLFEILASWTTNHEYAFDVARLLRMTRALLDDPSLDLNNRISACLGDDSLAQVALACADRLLQHFDDH